MASFWENYMIPIFILFFCAISLFWWLSLGYPFFDSLFISFFLSALIPSLIVIHEEFKKENEKNISLWIIGFLGAIIALQATWPIFMPRISLEDTNQLQGNIYADNRNRAQILQEAVIKVKPPLLPLTRSVDRNYPVANNLVVSEEYNSSNLEIIDGKSKDSNAIKVTLKHVTGWSFDELTGKIKYWTDKPLKVALPDKNISSSIGRTLNMTSFDESFKYPERFDYRYIFDVSNDETFPIEIFNLTFSIDKDTPAWNSLKKWTDDGFCVDIVVSKEWNYTLDKDRSYTYVNDKQLQDINKDTFNSSELSIKVGIIRLAPQEKNKRIDIIFRKMVCLNN